MCFVWISEQTAIISLRSINIWVFIAGAESVYCAVQTGSSNRTDSFVLKGLRQYVYLHSHGRLTSDAQVLGLFTFIVSEMLI